jgi:hypothetical protein
MYNHWAGVQVRTHAVALACQCHKFSPGDVVCKEGRKVAKKQLNKIKTWPVSEHPTHVQGFLGVCFYVRMFIPGLYWSWPSHSKN